MRNPEIQRLLREKLESMVEPSLGVFAEGLCATKRRAFIDKEGQIYYTDAEPDHRVRTATADRILDRYERASADHAGDLDSKLAVMPVQQQGMETPHEVHNGATADGDVGHGIDLDHLDPTDRVLVEEVAKINQELAQIDTELESGEQRGGSA